MQNQTNTVQLAFVIALLALSVILGIFTTRYVNLKQNELQVKLLEVCGNNAKRTYEENGKKSVEVEKNFYNDCLNNLKSNTL